MTVEPDRTAPPTNTEPGIVEILASYASAGFDGDAFVVAGGLIQCGTCGRTSDPDEVDVHSIRRIEGQSDPADMSGVLALVCPRCGARATAVVRSGPEADEDATAVWARLRDRRSSTLLAPDATPSESEAETGGGIAS